MVAVEVEGGVGGVDAFEFVSEAEGDHVGGFFLLNVVLVDEALEGGGDEGGVEGLGLLGDGGEEAEDEFVHGSEVGGRNEEQSWGCGAD